MASNSPTCLVESMEENPSYSFLDMELEALQSIFLNELEIKPDESCTIVSIDLYPATADKLEEQYVRMTLQFLLTEEYPEEIPEIIIRNPRGLSDEKVNSIMKDLKMIAESKKGNSMLFEMIDAAKEHLTVGNRPSGECAICLYGFSDNDVFTKTECYHYFHSHCLARYAKDFNESSKDSETDDAKSKAISNELLCPMCRLPIQFDECDAEYPPPEESDESEFLLTNEIVELQKKMADLYQKQAEKGGIIDVEAEKNKYLLEISNVPTRVYNEEKTEPNSGVERDSATDSRVESSDETNSPVRERKGKIRERNQKFDNRDKSKSTNKFRDYKENSKYDHSNVEQSETDNYVRKGNRNDYQKFNYRGNNRYYRKPREERGDSRYSQNTASEDIDRPNSRNRGYTRGYNSRFDSRGKNRNFNRPEENRDSYRSDHKFNKHYDNYHGHSKNSYGKQYLGSSHKQKEEYEVSDEDKAGISQVTGDAVEAEKVSNSEDVQDAMSENSEQLSTNSKSKYDPRFSSRYNRGYHNARNNSNYHSNYNRQSNKYRYHDHHNNSQTSLRDSAMPGEESLKSNSAERNEDPDVCDDTSAKSSHRSDRNKYDYTSKQKYQDSRNNPQRGYRGAYGRRDNYSRNSDYRDSRERDHPTERNFRDKRTYRDDRYRNRGNDDTYDRYGSRNYSQNRPRQYSDKSFQDSSNHENESLGLSHQNKESDASSLNSKSLPCSNHESESSKEVTTTHERESNSSNKKISSVVPNLDNTASIIPSNVNNETSQISSRSVKPPPGFANPHKKVIYGLSGANPPPGFNRS